MTGIFRSFLFALVLGIVASEITIIPQVQTIYDRAPKLRIKGLGFDADEHDIVIEIGAANTDPLRMNKDFILTKGDDGIILKLLTNRRWVDLSTRSPPVGLILSSVTFSNNPGKNLLPSPVIIANVYSTPTVKASSEIIYTSASNELRISGSGYKGAKKVDFYFDPPLLKEIAYEVVSSFPIEEDEIVLRLRHGYKWRDEPGPLRVMGVDTGGGPIQVDSQGVIVAEVQADLDLHGVTAQDLADSQSIYHDDVSVKVRGTGFNPDNTVFRFSNGILGKGVNYTINGLTETEATLVLTPGSVWRKNVENLPGYLTLLAVNAGAGFVAVGPMNSGKGRDVAKVFERPQVYSGLTKIYRTHSHEFHINGVGFPKVLTTPQLRFSPPLQEGRDYTITVNERTDMTVNLVDGREWASGPTDLLVTHINTRGDEMGWIRLAGDGVHVAQVVEDVAVEDTGGVEVYPSSTRVYQSAKQSSLEITGSGFKNGMTFTFSPALQDGSDYTMVVSSKNKVVLTLRNGRKWAKEAAYLLVKAVTVDGKSYSLANGDGIRVAIVLEDPSVEEGDDYVHETQSKVVVISGSGFTNVADLKVNLRPTVPGAYKILSVSDDTIRVQLKPDYDWLPSYLSLADSDKQIPLQISSIDTGAGDVVFSSPITIGQIVKDREGVVCDDSCEFAFDGVCDDGTEDEMYYNYYEYGGYYMDDDLGGYYGEGYYAQGDAYDDEYEFFYDDYYMEDDEMLVSACLRGTDCTDCGGVDAIIDYSNLDEYKDSGVVVCTNTCPYARDGQCDDPRGANYCILGTDCQDCGRVGADNFTMTDDDGWWDDDDDYWTFNDGNFIGQVDGLEANRHRVKVVHTESAGAAAVFLTMLEGMVYTIGAIFAAAALYLVMRWYKGHSIPFMQVFNPEASAMDLEMQPSRKMPITPDVIRT